VSERFRLPVTDAPVGEVTAALHRPPEGASVPVLLTHGAGGDLDAEGLVALAETITELGHPVVRVNLPYREAGQRGAPRAQRDVTYLGELLRGAGDHTELVGPWVVGGKSYGGRVASLLAADPRADAALLGLLFYGYPLHPPGRPDHLRVDHWPAIEVPCLFLQGTRDPFCDLSLLEEHASTLPTPPTIHVVEGGDHSLRVSRAASPDGKASRPSCTISGLRDVVDGWLATLEEPTHRSDHRDRRVP
jgi:uncharacterized protein